MGYEIGDPRPTAVEAPYTFFLPSQSELAAVSVGDIVKLLFHYTHDVEEWGTERMWVKVISREGNSFRGSLDNEPYESTSPLKVHDEVAFQRHHIISIDWRDPQSSPDPAQAREYWERCLVDECVLEGVEPVEYLYREEPDMSADEDKYPDSGWRIRGRRGSASDAEMENRKAAYVALGTVLNRDDSWIEWIDAPAGTELMRDFEKNEYAKCT